MQDEDLAAVVIGRGTYVKESQVLPTAWSAPYLADGRLVGARGSTRRLYHALRGRGLDSDVEPMRPEATGIDETARQGDGSNEMRHCPD
jgi:hypothetical protein